MLTTAPTAIDAGGLVRPLEPERRLPFALIWRDETASPALAEFVRLGVGRVREQTHGEISAWLGVGEERSRQLEREALHRLRAIAPASMQHAA
jgi:hypothetical protein